MAREAGVTSDEEKIFWGIEALEIPARIQGNTKELPGSGEGDPRSIRDGAQRNVETCLRNGKEAR